MQNGKEDVTNDQNDKFIFHVPTSFEPDELGLGHQLFRFMLKHRNHIAQFISETEEEETYDEILRRSIRTALHLQKRNLTKDDIVVLCTYNQKYSVVPFLASLFLTVPVAAFDPGLSILDISHLMKEVRPKVLFVIPEVLEVIEMSLEKAKIEAEIVVIGESDKYTEFSSFLEPHKDEAKFVPKPVDSLNDTTAIVFSSGTTGLPKGIMLNNYALQLQGHTCCNYVGSINLSYATFNWITPIITTIAIFELGAIKVLCQKFTPNNFWESIDKYKVTDAILVPSQAKQLIAAGRPDGVCTSSFYCCYIIGAPIPEKHLLDLRALFPDTSISQAYGLSETTGKIMVFDRNVREMAYLHNKPRSVGLLTPGIKCKIVNPETENICGPNEHGELRIKSRCIMNGYYNRESSGCFDNSAWFRTGDIMYFDNDGCFYVVDRIKEILRYQCMQVPPAMLEQVIMTHPAVSDAVVVGMPDEEDGDHPMALVIPKGNYKERIDTEEIVKFVEDRVSDRMKLRGGIKIMTSFPLTATGKIKRKELRDMVLRGEI